MSDTVQKWYAIINRRPLPNPVPAEDYHLVVLASDYDAAQARAEKAEYQIKVLRDLADIDTEERDRLAGVVERAGNLTRYRADIGVRIIEVVEADDLRRALAEPSEPQVKEPQFTRYAIYGSPGHGYEVTNTRGTEGFDATGRRYFDLHPAYTGYTPYYAAGDRRKTQRRKGESK